MKRKMTFSLGLTLSLLLSLVTFPSLAVAQQPLRFKADTGLIIPGPHQKLRITVIGMGTTVLLIRFRQMEYMQDANAVCKLSVSSQTTSAPIMLMPGEAASLELVASTYGRGIVLSNSQDARVTVQLIDTTTGQSDAILIALLVP